MSEEIDLHNPAGVERMARLIAWALLSIPVWFLGTAVVSNAVDEPGRSRGRARIMSVILFLIPWWALYLLSL